MKRRTDFLDAILGYCGRNSEIWYDLDLRNEMPFEKRIEKVISELGWLIELLKDVRHKVKREENMTKLVDHLNKQKNWTDFPPNREVLSDK